MSTDPIPAETLDEFERTLVPRWLQRGIPLAAVNDYMTLIRSMSAFNEGLNAWEHAGRPEPDGSDRFGAIYVARDTMITAALSLSTRDNLPDDWVRQYKLVIEDRRIMRAGPPALRIVKDSENE